jgi:hypothetical protein
MVFGRADWAERTVDVLQQHPICQPFSFLHHLRPDAPIRKECALRSNRSLAYGLSLGLTPRVESSGDSTGLKRGNTWAYNRELIDRVGFYDCGIIGGGDGYMIFAALGRHEDVVRNNSCTPAHAAHYRKWARRFYEAVQERIGLVEGDIFHLWHGDLADRRYDERNAILSDSNFDPETDIILDEQSCWRWNSPKYEMHRRMRQYFYERNEDGPLATEAAV